MIEWDYETEAECVHSLELSTYCGECMNELGDEWLRVVPIIVDPITYRDLTPTDGESEVEHGEHDGSSEG